jgi:hypothetical protein
MTKKRIDNKGINPKDLLGVKKTNVSLLPAEGVLQGAKAMKHGADKYGAYNWRDNKVQAMIYIDAILRHTYEYLEGNDVDKDSGEHPIAHVIANGCLLMDAIKYDCLVDNRPGKKEKKQEHKYPESRACKDNICLCSRSKK